MRVRLTTRVIAPTVLVSLLMLLVGGVAAWYLHRLQQDSSALMCTSVKRLRAAEELEIVGHEVRNLVNRYLVSGDRELLKRAESRRADVDRWIAEAMRLAATARERNLIEQLRQGFEHFFLRLEAIAAEPQVARQREPLVQLLHDAAPKTILEPAQQYRDLNAQLTSEASRRNQAIADRMGLGLLLLGACGAVAGLVAGYGIARSVHRSIVELSVPIRDATGKMSEVVGPITVASEQDLEGLEAALQNMSQRVGAVVERLHEAQRAAARSERLAAMGQLAAGLAHELRNPLTSIKMLLQPAAPGTAPVPLDWQDAAVVNEEIGRLERTIQTFLDYARPPRPERRTLAIQPVIRQTVELVARRAAERGISIDCVLPERAIEIQADAGQLRQVLMNLLLNALDASAQGQTISVRAACGPLPSATAEEVVSGPRWVAIEVGDRGPGLPAGEGERIFEPFVSTKEAGTGLGLPISRRIVEDHGGRLDAADRDGGGAVFTVRLPVDGRPARPPVERLQPSACGDGHHADAPDRG